MRKILYIQHASTLCGSTMSLLYTMQGLEKTGYQLVLALAHNDKEVIDFYKEAGFAPIPFPGIVCWNPHRHFYNVANWPYLFKVALSWNEGKRKTLELVRLVKPDLVHLNSVVLSASAVALAEERVPFVWHIRESPPQDYGAICTRITRRLILDCPGELIFISESDRQAWVGGERGQVIYNFVDFQRFDRAIDGTPTRKELGISQEAPVVLYLGGLRRVKGIFVLIKALNILKKRLPNPRCLMPGSVYESVESDTERLKRRVSAEISNAGLEDTCIRMVFQANIAPLIAASDVLAFPAIQPHFARPVIEASAMAKPVVASRLAGIDELVQDNKTGIIIEPNNPELLSQALFDLLSNKEIARQIGEAGYRYAKEKFSAEYNCSKIMQVYDEVLKNMA